MFRNVSFSIFLILILIMTSGCAVLIAGAVGGTASAIWLSGKLVQTVDVPFDDVIDAAKSALDSLDLKISREIKKESLAQIISNYSDGRTIWIDIHKIGTAKSRIDVRVGLGSDKSAAGDILDEILNHM